MNTTSFSRFAATSIVLALSQSLHGQVIYGIDFVTVGAAGNRPTNAQEAAQWDYRGGAGGVSYDFRMARNELTVGQYLEFVNAYAPYWTGNPNASALTGFWIVRSGGSYIVRDGGSADFPADMPWQMAARYCNWLTNGKATGQEAFEHGAYETSTFTRSADGTWNDQPTRSPGATFWIPSLDEWTKAVYYDPNRYGLGQEGYWRQPNGTDIPLLSGLPQDGGQTSGGLADPDPRSTLAVGSYPNVMTPWGLLDASGGVAEATEEFNDRHTYRVRKGSWQGNEVWSNFDSIEGWSSQAPNISITSAGLRIASIPAPTTGLCGLMAGAVVVLRRRRL